MPKLKQMNAGDSAQSEQSAGQPREGFLDVLWGPSVDNAPTVWGVIFLPPTLLLSSMLVMLQLHIRYADILWNSGYDGFPSLGPQQCQDHAPPCSLPPGG